jgi:hypothetical protein
MILRKTPIFFAENWQKSQKLVIITSTPGRTVAESVFEPVKSVSERQKGLSQKSFSKI